MAPKDAAPPPAAKTGEAAGGRPFGVPAVSFGTDALRLLENGYGPLPIVPSSKRPAVPRWAAAPIDRPGVERWAEDYGHCGIGLRTGALVGIDIDVLDPDLAHEVDRLTRSRLGDTLMRVGQWPKRLLVYRTDRPFQKMSLRGLEVLGLGQQFVAFGIHPGTGRPYDWPLGDTPLDVPFDAMPPVDRASCEALLGRIAAVLPETRPSNRRSRQAPSPAVRAFPLAPVRDECGRVVDGRDAWLSTIAYHAVQDALDAGDVPDAGELAAAVWRRFEETADLGRSKGCSAERYRPADAARKVADKVRLATEGRLPSRRAEPAEPVAAPPTLPVERARKQLDLAIGSACERILAWHADPARIPAPQIGVRATVGLGKSVTARRHLLALRLRLVATGAPSRILVLAPSHALAEETAEKWRQEGIGVAVLRGYEAHHPALRQPMCRDIEAVRGAVLARVDVQSSVCGSPRGRHCAFIEGCPKQQNRVEIAAAVVVVAAYDALYSGFAIDAATVGVMLIDEGCWSRALSERRGLTVEGFGSALLPAARDGDLAADLHVLRGKVVKAFSINGVGPVRRSSLREAGLTVADADTALNLEARLRVEPGLYPGMPAGARRVAIQRADVNEHAEICLAVWRAVRRLLTGNGQTDGRLLVGGLRDGGHPILVLGLKSIHPNLRDLPLLHLDATLRPPLAATILPRIEVEEIAVEAPFTHLRLVTGSFAKTSLCPHRHADEPEKQRRANRLRECVAYVAWQARRVAPGRVLVVTYLDVENAFGGIAGVAVAHFNAIAGLDAYRDVRLLIVIGRPLPPSASLHRLSGAFFGQASEGTYQHVLREVPLRDGTSASVRVVAHADQKAEILRAAICDDEVLQAIGRGRGVNRTAADPLEVHVLADVALPLVHDEVVAWEMIAPDILQRMLLVGIAVDSPADAAVLHPALFSGEKQAQKVFERAAFKRQNPIRNIYREMSLKSARYRRPGRGRSWQRAWWLTGDAAGARRALEAGLGALAEWRPDP